MKPSICILYISICILYILFIQTLYSFAVSYIDVKTSLDMQGFLLTHIIHIKTVLIKAFNEHFGMKMCDEVKI